MTSQIPILSAAEDIEGLDTEPEQGWGDYPIDTVLIRTETRTIHDVVRRIAQGTFIMNPEFQRDFIWPDDKQSKLIESVLMRIPLPVFYLAEDSKGRMIVVDGLQRLSTFQEFLSNKSRLRLPEQADLNRRTFQDLPPKLQNRIEDCNLILYIIDAKVPERARLDIFERVNGGVPLTRQQMRNCLYMGKATAFLKQEASTDLFIAATGNSLKPSTMRDRELVNRFCSFYLQPLTAYRGDMDELLAATLVRMNKFTPEQLQELSKQFRLSLTNNFHVFGKHAFRKHHANQSDRSIFNASLWDVLSTGLSHYPSETVEKNAQSLRNALHNLMEDEAFISSITYSPNSTKNVRLRFDLANRMLAEVFGAFST